MSRRRSQPQGFTLVEIIFSIAFLTMILATVLSGFVGIMGIYNRSQGLGLTADAARNSLNATTEDLRQTIKVEYFSDSSATDTFNPNPRTAPFSGDALAGSVKDFYCLTSDTKQIGYALVRHNSTSKFHLTRFSGSTGANGCSSLTNAQQLVSNDLWSDGGGAETLPANYRPFIISKVNSVAPSTDPPVWQVRVAVYRGSRIPGVSAPSFTDQFSASTTLQSLVLARP